MRINYSDEEDRPGQFDLWQANCRRSLNGRAGQAALRELEAELMAMPERRLIADDLAADGEVCAVGALMKRRLVTAGAEPTAAQARLEDLNDSEWESDYVAAQETRVPRLVAWKLVELNDIELEGMTPEARYSAVLEWVRGQITAAAA